MGSETNAHVKYRATFIFIDFIFALDWATFWDFGYGKHRKKKNKWYSLLKQFRALSSVRFPHTVTTDDQINLP